MPELIKRKVMKRLKSNGILSNEVKSYANEPFFLEKAEKAKVTLSKMDLSVIKKKE